MQNEKITIETIETKEFHVAARGYNQHEVDEFLDSICDEMERMESEVNALQEENRLLQQRSQANAPAASVAAPAAPVASASAEGTFREILEMAQRVKDQTIADAQAKAEEIVRNAEIESKARLGNLSAEKEKVERELESLKAAVKAYKESFAGMIALAQDALDAAQEL